MGTLAGGKGDETAFVATDRVVRRAEKRFDAGVESALCDKSGGGKSSVLKRKLDADDVGSVAGLKAEVLSGG